MDRFSYLGRISTARLRIEDWASVPADPHKASELKTALATALTPQVTQYLPLSMQFPRPDSGIDDWIADRSEEAHVLLVKHRDRGTFAGLILLHAEPGPEQRPTINLGYFFHEDYWGQGYASEAVKALVAALEAGPPAQLIAGVDKSNAASANVLRKSGFSHDPEQSTATRDYFVFSTG
ncbi:GNAT family N-acetyltransferase [Ruegeria sp.]|uniref:GNAT family N-acetyltransferase n=1 Tax=Ruegeria sp. TaxID=1879320 RepID=UPI003C79952D